MTTTQFFGATIGRKSQPSDDRTLCDLKITLTTKVDGLYQSVTTVNISQVEDNSPFFIMSFLHPSDYPITENNWYRYLHLIDGNFVTNGIEFEKEAGPQKPGFKATLTTDSILGCVVLELVVGDQSRIVIAIPDDRDDKEKFILSKGIQIIDHGYDEDVSYQISFDGYKVYFTPMVNGETTPGLPRYYFVLKNDKPIPAPGILDLYLCAGIRVKVTGDQEQSDDPLRMMKQSIGDFYYAKSNDGKLTIMIDQFVNHNLVASSALVKAIYDLKVTPDITAIAYIFMSEELVWGENYESRDQYALIKACIRAWIRIQEYVKING